MEIDIANADPAGFDVLGTPTVRMSPGGIEVLAEVKNRGAAPLHDCWVYLLAKNEVAELVDFAEVLISFLGPGAHRPLRMKVMEPGCEDTIVTITLQLAPADAAPGARGTVLPDYLQPIRPVEPKVTRTMPAAAAKAVPLVRHGTGVLLVEDSAVAVREGDDRVVAIAEITNASDQLLPAVRLQVLGYGAAGFIVAIDEAGPWPLEPGQSRAARVVLGPVEHAIATIGLFAVSDAAIDTPNLDPS